MNGPRQSASIPRFSATSTEVEVFTTRPDTLFGATYLVLAPEHELIENEKARIKNYEEVKDYVERAKNKTEMERLESKEKTGVKLDGLTAINPANGEEILIFVADYVLGGYGTGAIMAVPAHDERDYEFAKKYNLPVKPVILKKSDASYSFIMGIDSISEGALKRLGVEVLEKTDKGFYKVRIPYDKLEAYKEFIRENMTPGFWNEFSTKIGFYFIFKHKDGKIEEFELNPDTNDQIDIYGMTFNDEKPKSSPENVYGWLAENSFYKEILIHSDSGVLINSGKFDGMDSEEAKKAITEFVGGEMTTNYRLRDWSISRQRYWGCPIPIVYSPEGKATLVPEEHLPWTLPTDVDFKPTGISPLSESKELKERVEKIFGEGWTPEYDTMDTFVDSSWYFLRYPDMQNEKEFCSKERQKWLPPELYIGGAEHTYMHLLFARFFVKAMNKIGLLDFDEPFPRLRHQGMVLDKEGKKMSKSKGNVVNPDEMVERFGADSVRTYMLFAAPLEDEVIWNEDNVVGIYRFLEKVWNIFEKDFEQNSSQKVERELHKLIKRATKGIDDLKYNTVVSDMMKFINLVKKEGISERDYKTFLKILSPFAPHITEEIWQKVTSQACDSIHKEKWPEYDEAIAKDDVYKIIIQVNGKVRDEMEIEDGENEKKIKEKALQKEKVQKWIDDNEIKKIIYVKNKLVNIVV